MVVAAIAWADMTPEARARASELLRLNPQYDEWTRGVPANRRDQAAFLEASTWPDALRGMVCSNGPHCIRDDGYTPPDANADLNIGYSDRRLRRYWHFKDLPFSTDGTALEQPFSPNAETQIVQFSASLRQNGLAEEAKSYNLSWLLHLVGDVHQPLHATARFSRGFPDGDNGGNGEVVCRPRPARCVTTGRSAEKLHGLWDGAIGNNSRVTAVLGKSESLLASARSNGSFLSIVVGRTNLDAPPDVWLSESFELARRYAYAPPIGDGRGPHFPTDAYKADAGSVASQQIVIAGMRLARILNRQLAD